MSKYPVNISFGDSDDLSLYLNGAQWSNMSWELLK